MRQVLDQAGRQIDSDFELASLLISSDRLLTDDATRRAYFDAARSIQSDFEMRRALSAALKQGKLSPDVLVGVLDTSTSIDSDFEEAELLVQIAKLQPLDAKTRSAFLKAVATVGSDFERRKVLSAVVRADPSPDTLATMLDPAVAINSDFEQASFLLDVANSQSIDGALRVPFFKGVDTIDSNFERGRVLKAVVKRGSLPAETLVAVLRSAQGMDSGFETSQVLQAVVATNTAVRRGARDLRRDRRAPWRFRAGQGADGARQERDPQVVRSATGWSRSTWLRARAPARRATSSPRRTTGPSPSASAARLPRSRREWRPPDARSGW